MSLHSINRLLTPSVLHGGTKSIYVDPPGAAQWGFSGHYPELAALCSVCVQGLVATAELLWSSPFQPGLVPPGVGASLLAATCSRFCGSACSGPPSCDAWGRAGAHANELLCACELSHFFLPVNKAP